MIVTIPWRASLWAALIAALTGVGLLTAIAAWHAGRLEGETVFFMLAVALPAALAMALPVAFVVLPAVHWFQQRTLRPSLGILTIIGAVAGFVIPLAVAIRFRSRFVVEGWTIAAIYMFASTVAGAICALVYHRAARPRAP